MFLFPETETMSAIVPRSYFEHLIGQHCSDNGWDLDDVISFLHRVVEELRFDILEKRGTAGVWVISTKKIPTKQRLSKKPVQWSWNYRNGVSLFPIDHTREFTVSLRDGVYKCLIVTLPHSLPIECVARSTEILPAARSNGKNQDMKQLNLCFNCLRKPDQRKRCSRCSVASYCSEACQKKDWPRHKHQCQKDQDDRDASRITFNLDNIANMLS